MSTRGDLYILEKAGFAKNRTQCNRYFISHDAYAEYVQKLLRKVDFDCDMPIANQIIAQDVSFIALENCDKYGGFWCYIDVTEKTIKLKYNGNDVVNNIFEGTIAEFLKCTCLHNDCYTDNQINILYDDFCRHNFTDIQKKIYELQEYPFEVRYVEEFNKWFGIVAGPCELGCIQYTYKLFTNENDAKAMVENIIKEFPKNLFS